MLDRSRATHLPSGAVTTTPKGVRHAPVLTGQHPTRSPHISWDEYRLADLTVAVGHFGVSGWKCSRGSFAVHPNLAIHAACVVTFELGNVMSDIVDQVHLHLFPVSSEYRFKRLAGLPHEQLPIAPRKIRRGAHRAQIMLALGALNRRTRKLAIGQFDAVLVRYAAKAAQCIIAYLIAETS
jgi:hypothetical protein